MMIGAFSNAALAAAVPYYVGQAFNAITEGQGLELVLSMALAIVGSQLLRAGLQLMRNFSAEIFAQRIERDVRDELYASLLGKSMSFHDMQPVGEIMARVTNDVREMNFMMNPGMNLIVGSGMFLIAPLIAAPRMYPDLIAAPLVFLVCYVVVQIRYLRRLNPIAQNVRASFGTMNASVAETIDGLQVVKGAAQEDRERSRFSQLVDEVRDYVVQQGDIEAQYLPILLLGLVTFGAFFHVTSLYTSGLIPIGTVIAYAGQIALVRLPGVLVAVLVFAAFARYGERCPHSEHHHDRDGARPERRGLCRAAQGQDHVRSGRFRLQRNRHAGAARHQLYRRAGADGRHRRADRIGQVDADQADQPHLRRGRAGACWSTAWTCATGIWRNCARRSASSSRTFSCSAGRLPTTFAFGKPEATQEEVEEAAKKAQAHEFILSFPEGYQTVIGQRGVTLSGGQRQRLALARAFVTNPPILVLDDSTSAIDSATEDRIQKAIWSAAKGRTTLLITHRLSQIRWADHIVVLRQGRVVAQGKHEDLLQSSDAYRRIFARYDEPAQDSADEQTAELNAK